MVSIGFIGVGNMGGALASAAAKNTDNVILINDSDSAKVKSVADKLSAKAASIEEICSSTKYIFIGVKPQVISGVLMEMSEYLKNRSDRYIIVSMAAGVSTGKLGDMMGYSAPIIRIMPNLPVSVGEGMILYTANKSVQPEEVDELISAMKFSGIWDFTEESFIDAASALSGCGPAFVFMFLEALADGGVDCGLTRDKALKLAAQTLKGSAIMVQQGGHPGQLKDSVCSPAGSTIEGVKSLESAGFKETVINAVEKSFKRTKELGK